MEAVETWRAQSKKAVKRMRTQDLIGVMSAVHEEWISENMIYCCERLRGLDPENNEVEYIIYEGISVVLEMLCTGEFPVNLLYIAVDILNDKTVANYWLAHDPVMYGQRWGS